MNEKIPVPITFNTYKHHFQFLLKQIELWQKQEWQQVESEIILIGENLLDFYTGDLTVENICTECLYFFNMNSICNKVEFEKWLNPYEYKKIKLSDSSEWIIKNGNDECRYIHIHPGKQSPHSKRIRATTLKTVLALMVKTSIISDNMHINLEKVNFIRTTHLHLSPVKSIQRDKGILHLWEMFLNHYQPGFR